MGTILLAERVGSDQATHLVRTFERVANEAGATTIDATATAMFGPLAVVVLGLAVVRRRARGQPDLQLLLPRDGRVASFLGEVGFVRLLSGDDPTRRRADTLELRQMLVHDRLYTERLADILVGHVRGYDEDASHLVHLCVNELLQNTFEHAGSPEGGFVHCRWYQKDGNVRIAVADGGIGIPAALRRSVESLRRESDAAVIEAAVVREGLTSTHHHARGLGLKLIRDVVTRRKGRLAVVSHGAVVTFGPGAAIRRRRCEHFRGTAIEIDFRPHLTLGEGESIL